MKATNTITLTNDFHNSSISLKRSTTHLSAGQVAKARRALCGTYGCTCGGVAGTRGVQRLPDGTRFTLLATADGGADVEIGFFPIEASE